MPQRIGLLIDYRITNGTRIGDMTVTVIKLKKPMHLLWASHLAGNRSYRQDSTHGNLYDDQGKAIPTNQMVDIQSFEGYWIRSGNSGIDDLPVRREMQPAVKQLNATIVVPLPLNTIHPRLPPREGWDV